MSRMSCELEAISGVNPNLTPTAGAAQQRSRRFYRLMCHVYLNCAVCVSCARIWKLETHVCRYVRTYVCVCAMVGENEAAQQAGYLKGALCAYTK